MGSSLSQGVCRGTGIEGSLQQTAPPLLGFELAVLQHTREQPVSYNLQGIFDRKEVCHFQIRSLTPQSRQVGTGNLLAVSVHEVFCVEKFWNSHCALRLENIPGFHIH
jgi:hypothetical protein